MKKDFLFDALNEISDEHIAEAATYEKKSKAVRWKALLPIAACFIIAAISLAAFGGRIPFVNVEPTLSQSESTTISDSTTQAGIVAPTTDDTSATSGTNAPTLPPPEASSEPSNTVAGTTNAQCPTVPWFNRPLYYTTPTLDFDGKKYICATDYYSAEFYSKNISGVLKEDKIIGYNENYEKAPVDVLICEIRNVDKDNAVAVIRKDGLQGGYSIFIEQSLADSKDMNELLTKLNFKENLILSYSLSMYSLNNGTPESWISYYKKNPVAYFKENILDIYEGATDIIKCEGDEQKSINDAFISLLEKNMDKAEYVNEVYEPYQYFAEDCLEFSGYICAYEFRVIFTEKGKLYFITNAGATCYNLTREDFESFLSLVQGSK